MDYMKFISSHMKVLGAVERVIKCQTPYPVVTQINFFSLFLSGNQARIQYKWKYICVWNGRVHAKALRGQNGVLIDIIYMEMKIWFVYYS